MERGVGDARQDQENNFEPHPLLRNPHVATAVAACWQRTVSPQHVEERLFEVIVTALDDPFIPFESFHHPAIVGNRSIALVAPEHGGHCAFISRNSVRERFWAESRVVEFCAEHSEIVKYTGPHSKSGDLLTPRNAHQSRARQGAHKFQPRKPFVVFPLSWCSKLPRAMFCPGCKAGFRQGSTTCGDCPIPPVGTRDLHSRP